MVYLLVLALTAILASRTTPVSWDYDNLFAYEFPSSAFWRQHLDDNRDQIVDGLDEPPYLNDCYRGGWNRCLSNFQNGYTEWNYYWLKENEPHEMSGNMVDTDRIAGQLGWKHCTERLTIAIENESPESIKSQMRRLSNEWITFFFAMIFGILLFGLNYWLGRKDRPTA